MTTRTMTYGNRGTGTTHNCDDHISSAPPCVPAAHCDAYLYNGTRCGRTVVVIGQTEDGLDVQRCKLHQADVAVKS